MKPSKARAWLRRNAWKMARTKVTNVMWFRTKIAKKWKEVTVDALMPAITR